MQKGNNGSTLEERRASSLERQAHQGRGDVEKLQRLGTFEKFGLPKTSWQDRSRDSQDTEIGR